MEHYEATPEQWAAGRYDWSKADTEAMEGDPAFRCILELRARVEQLEDAQQDKLDRLIAQDRDDAPALAGSLVERVGIAIDSAEYDEEGHRWDEARAAIREVAAWLKETHGWSNGSLMRLEQEADQ